MRRGLIGTLLAAIAAALVYGSIALADQLIGVGNGYWSGRISATTTSAAIDNVTDGGAADALFPCGTSYLYNMVQVQAYGAARVGFAGHPGATLGAMVWDDDFAGGGEGGGDIRSFGSNGGEWHTRPHWASMVGRPGGANGICTIAVTTIAGLSLYPSCGATGDCTTLSAGTCETDLAQDNDYDQKANVGCYFIAESDSGTVVVDVHAETVRR